MSTASFPTWSDGREVVTEAVDWEALEAAGVFDPGVVPDGLAIRKSLVEYLASLGATSEQIIRASSEARRQADPSTEKNVCCNTRGNSDKVAR